MKKTSKISAVFSLLLFLGGTAAFAGESLSISVSCTVPAVPGVNTPYLEQVAAADIRPKAQSREDYEQEDSRSLIEEETSGNEETTEGEKEIILVRTFYVR